MDHDFAPDYVITEDRRKQVSAIEKAAKSAANVWLATDLDREGEAIAWPKYSSPVCKSVPRSIQMVPSKYTVGM